MNRWFLFSIGLAIAAGALYALLADGIDSGPPLDDIDDASRAKLEKVLRDSERSAAR